jgi:Raf kinase inhibitor-like YbhB/YbcL family protein
MNQHQMVHVLLLAALGLFCLTGCRAEVEQPENGSTPIDRSSDPAATSSTREKPMAMHLSSTAFAEGAPIPKKYSGEGTDVSPPLAWKNFPEGTKELALICDDPDAPTAEPWVHWVIYKIPIDAKGLPENVPTKARLKTPSGALQGKNSWTSGQMLGYRGPLPPTGHTTHNYRFTLYALEGKLVIEPGVSKNMLMGEMQDHIIEEVQLIGTYER